MLEPFDTENQRHCADRYEGGTNPGGDEGPRFTVDGMAVVFGRRMRESEGKITKVMRAEAVSPSTA